MAATVASAAPAAIVVKDIAVLDREIVDQNNTLRDKLLTAGRVHVLLERRLDAALDTLGRETIDKQRA